MLLLIFAVSAPVLRNNQQKLIVTFYSKQAPKIGLPKKLFSVPLNQNRILLFGSILISLWFVYITHIPILDALYIHNNNTKFL